MFKHLQNPESVLKGWIIAPLSDEQEILNAGFNILSKQPNDENFPKDEGRNMYDFEVEGHKDCLNKIDHRWGEWVWTIGCEEEIGRFESVIAGSGSN